MRGRTEIVRLFLAAGANPNTQNDQGYTPLHHTTRAEIVHCLLNGTPPADPNLQNMSGDTPLHIASCYEHTENASLLLAAGANPTAPNERGETPADLAKSDEMAALFAGLTRVKGAGAC